MQWPKLFLIIPGILGFMILVFAIVLLVVKLLWAWTIPDLFPGAVEQGLVAGTIPWLPAFKLAVFVAVLAGVAVARRGSSE